VIEAHIKTPSGRDALYTGYADENGLPHGHGEFVVTSKDEFEGDVLMGIFEHGTPQGICKAVAKNGRESIGQWISGKLNGVVYHQDPGGVRYCGQFKDGKSHDIGTYTYSNGDVYIGWFSNGKLHGVGLFVKQDGVKAAVEYEHGELVSSSTSGLLATFRMKDSCSSIDPQMVHQRESDMNGL
jgi:hypothetical protein